MYCFDNKLTHLDINNCEDLGELWLNDNSLTKLDLTKNKKLKSFWCGDNNLSELIISAENEIETLYCGESNAQLRSIFLLNLKTEKLIRLELPDHLENQNMSDKTIKN